MFGTCSAASPDNSGTIIDTFDYSIHEIFGVHFEYTQIIFEYRFSCVRLYDNGQSGGAAEIAGYLCHFMG